MAKNRNKAKKKTAKERKGYEKTGGLDVAIDVKQRIICDRRCGRCSREECPIKEKVCFCVTSANGTKIFVPKVGKGRMVAF